MISTEKSSDVRRHWAESIDQVVHQAPKFIKRHERDVIHMTNLEYLSALLEPIRYSVNLELDTEAGEFVATMDGFWFVESGYTEDEAINNIAKELIDYANEYYNDLKAHFSAPNLRPQYSQVMKAVITNDFEKVKQYFDVQHV